MSKVTKKDIDTALRNALASFGLDHIEVAAGVDHDGEPALFVTAILPPKTPPIPGEISASANVAITRAMEKAGDDRLSYLHIRRPDDDRPADEKTVVSSQ